MTAGEDVDRSVLERLAALTPDERADPGTWARIAEVLDYWHTYAANRRRDVMRAQVLADHPELELELEGSSPPAVVDVATGGRL